MKTADIKCHFRQISKGNFVQSNIISGLLHSIETEDFVANNTKDLQKSEL